MSASKPSGVSRFNGMAVRLLRSPFHRLLSKNTLVLTFTGRKSGRSITTPISYARCGDTLLCVTPSAWAKNLMVQPHVAVVLRGKHVEGQATVTPPGSPANMALLQDFFQRVPRDMQFYNVHRMADGTLNRSDIERVAAKIYVMQIQLA